MIVNNNAVDTACIIVKSFGPESRIIKAESEIQIRMNLPIVLTKVIVREYYHSQNMSISMSG